MKNLRFVHLSNDISKRQVLESCPGLEKYLYEGLDINRVLVYVLGFATKPYITSTGVLIIKPEYLSKLVEYLDDFILNKVTDDLDFIPVIKKIAATLSYNKVIN